MNAESEDTHALIMYCSDYSHKLCSFSFKLPGKQQASGKKHVLNKEVCVSFSSTLPFEFFFFFTFISIWRVMNEARIFVRLSCKVLVKFVQFSGY